MIKRISLLRTVHHYMPNGYRLTFIYIQSSNSLQHGLLPSHRQTKMHICKYALIPPRLMHAIISHLSNRYRILSLITVYFPGE